MRKLYQILYNVGRLTDAPGGGRFLARGDTLAWASLRGGKALGVTKPAFPPRAPPFRARRCSALWYVTMYWQMPVCCCIGHVQLCRWMCGNVTPNSSYLPYPREQARCAGRFPVRRNKNRLSLTLPIQQHTGLSR